MRYTNPRTHSLTLFQYGRESVAAWGLRSSLYRVGVCSFSRVSHFGEVNIHCVPKNIQPFHVLNTYVKN